jgi:hypothetical protein
LREGKVKSGKGKVGEGGLINAVLGEGGRQEEEE